MYLLNPFPNNFISEWSKLKEFADDIFKFVENSRKFSKPVQNTEGKREIARYEQFLLSHSVFRRCVQQSRKHQSFFGKGLNTDTNALKNQIFRQKKAIHS